MKVTLDVAPSAFESWNEAGKQFAVNPGERTVEVPSPSAHIRLTGAAVEGAGNGEKTSRMCTVLSIFRGRKGEQNGTLALEPV